MLTDQERRCGACGMWCAVDADGEWKGAHGSLALASLFCDGHPTGRRRTRRHWVVRVLAVNRAEWLRAGMVSGRTLADAVRQVEANPLWRNRKWALI